MAQIPELMSGRALTHPATFDSDVHLKYGVSGTKYWSLFEDFVGAAGSTLPSWLTTHDTSAAGSPTLDYVSSADGGQFTLTTDNTSEAQNIAIYGGDSLPLDTAKEPWFEARVKLNTAGAAFTADQRLVIGLAAARNATLNDNATHAWFRIEGANFNILTEVDDAASGDDDDNDSGLDWSDNGWAKFRVRIDSLGYAKFEVDLEDGARGEENWVQAGELLDLTALVASSVNWQPYIEMQRDAGTEVEAVHIDYIAIGAKR